MLQKWYCLTVIFLRTTMPDKTYVSDRILCQNNYFIKKINYVNRRSLSVLYLCAYAFIVK